MILSDGEYATRPGSTNCFSGEMIFLDTVKVERPINSGRIKKGGNHV
jgi:hypothetical protein